MKIYPSHVLCSVSYARDGNASWEEKEREQVIWRAPIMVHGCMLEGPVSTVVLGKGMERAEFWQIGAGEGSHWKCRKLSKSVLLLGVLFFSDFLQGAVSEVLLEVFLIGLLG